MKTCCDCAGRLGKGNTSGRCRSCANAIKNRSPAMREIASKTMAAGRASGRISLSREMRSLIGREIANRPGARERLAEQGRKGRASRTPEADAAAAKKQSATLQRRREERLTWCPLDRRAEFARLSVAYGVAEAKRIIIADMAAIERRRLAAMTPLERQLERVRQGARVVTKQSTTRTLDFTVGGVATGAL